jgi:Tautomerase enzyme
LGEAAVELPAGRYETIMPPAAVPDMMICLAWSMDGRGRRRAAQRCRLRADFYAPDRDRYQIITEHERGQIIAEDTGLGFERTDDIVIVQILQRGRTLHHKRAAYKALAERLQGETGLNPSDLIVSVVENSRDDPSFGNGIAQFVEGQLT